MPAGTTAAGQSDSVVPTERSTLENHTLAFAFIDASTAGSAAAKSCRSPKSSSRL
jgi:hypothetical protein